VVLRGIADALDAHRHSWARHQKVNSLSYCAAEVDAARERWERALALGSEPGLDVVSILIGFAAALESAEDLGESASKVAERAAAELRELARRSPPASETEAQLAAVEKELVEAVSRDLGSAAMSELEAAVAEELEKYEARMPSSVLAQVRRESRVGRLLGRFRIPRLSLFHAAG
jgi:hypothetical protein